MILSLSTNRQFRAAIGLPPHFYGVLVKTDDGCQILQTKGHFADFVQFIRKHGFESEDPELIMKLKSVLWAVVSKIVVDGITEMNHS